ncbi:MAG: cytochrome P450 [Acidimicrobiales bacterium]
MSDLITITTYAEARHAYRQKDLRQALYDAGEVIMGDVLVNLHGDDHRARRRVENRLYRRETFVHYEQDLFPAIIAETVDPYVADGKAELVSLGHQLMMNLAALTAGVDRPAGTAEESFRLYDYLTVFIEGATLAHYTGDKEAKAAEVAAALERFGHEFLDPGIERRRRALAEVAAGDRTEDELPKDVLCVLLQHEDELELSYEAIRREVAFYLLAGAHTSATAFTRVTHNILTWLADHPEDGAAVRNDRVFVQRATHETIRLQPSSPVGMRWALDDIELPTGTTVRNGDRVVIDLISVNRDRSVFGDDAEDFNPHRPRGDVPPYGLSFGFGMHACIGQDMAAGVPLRPDGPNADVESEHLFGLVPVAVQYLFDHGVAADPDDPPEMDASTSRPYFGRYPILFRGG